jgi:excisionase family DNA binding protein
MSATAEISASPHVTPFAKLAKAAPAVYTAQEVADLLQVSLRQVWVMRDSGAIPAPFQVGRLVRWSRAVVDGWIASGCPKPTKGN